MSTNGSFQIDQNSFNPWYDDSPSTDPMQKTIVHVRGQGTGNYRVDSAKLEFANPQGINPTILILDVIVKLDPEQDPHPQFERVFDLAYDGQPGDGNYVEVTVRHGDQAFSVPVKHVQ